MSDQPTVAEALWAKVPGQAEAVRQLRAAVSMPTHAYLISGPPGAGKRELATAFCASLLARGLDGDEADRVAARVESGDHGGVVVVEREGPFITADDARRVVERASRSPLEGDLQIIVIIDFHLVRDAGPMLLKSIEEPPPRTMFVLLSEELPRELETIASRCVVINVDAVPVDTLLELLVSEGIDDDVARAAAEVAGGSLTRARLLARDPKVSHRRDLWYRVPERLNGRGSRAGEVADDLVGSIEDLKAPLAEMEAEELTALDARAESMGIDPTKGEINRIKDRYKRTARRLHTDEMRVGLGVLVGRYRDEVLSGADPEDFLKASDLVQGLCDNLVFNVGDELALQSLLMSLPPIGQ
ncbi:MAG: hypothetical protein V9F03_09915 [Microthrixaceae bacterium]